MTLAQFQHRLHTFVLGLESVGPMTARAVRFIKRFSACERGWCRGRVVSGWHADKLHVGWKCDTCGVVKHYAPVAEGVDRDLGPTTSQETDCREKECARRDRR
jgi:hypothetical protein